MDAGLEIENKKSELFRKRMENELNYMKQKLEENGQLNIFDNGTDINLQERIDILQKIIKTELNNGLPENKPIETVQQKRENLFKEIDKFTYKKQWNKLPPFHKIVKIKEFVQQSFGEGDFQNNLINDLTKLANEGKINTKKFVVYDPNSEKILSIPILTVDITKKNFTLKVL